MPWRPEGTPPTHECERCSRPLHTAIACPGVTTDNLLAKPDVKTYCLLQGKYDCNRKCVRVGTTAAASAKKAVKATKLESVRSSRQTGSAQQPAAAAVTAAAPRSSAAPPATAAVTAAAPRSSAAPAAPAT
eukprot:2329582-Pleurochrysis_carterae.AAC.1